MHILGEIVMKKVFFTLVFSLFILVSGAFAQTSWLDKPLRNWNTSSSVPVAPRATGDSPGSSLCRDSVRSPESIADRAVTRAGWSLFGAAQIYGGVTLINGMAAVDGMCRPTQFNTFIFVANRFAGTLSPDLMNSRTDGALVDASLNDATSITAEFVRYTSSDPLCCPSQRSFVSYQIAGSRVQAQNVSTSLACKTQTEEPVDPNVVSGTVTYRERIALPRNAILTVRLVDITRQSAPSKLITEQRINLNGQQVPISFALRFNEKDISFRNDYAVEAEISSGGRVLYKNDVTRRVLTQGNPNKVEITVLPVGVSEPVNDGVLLGTVDYRQRIALPTDSEIKVKLIDVSSAANDPGRVIAEDNFLSNGRQVPLSFQLRFDKNQISPNRTYVVEAEIYTGGKLAYKNEKEYSVLTQNNPATNVEIMLVGASDDKEEPIIITGKEINISKFGTGSFGLEGRSSELIVRARVKFDKNGKAEVTLSPIGAAITFSGNLTYADDDTLRITVTNSGNADASGEIEVKYSGRRLNSVNSKDLILDGQKATISF
jgi:uncharacterized lipoprotein YbaY